MVRTLYCIHLFGKLFKTKLSLPKIDIHVFEQQYSINVIFIMIDILDGRSFFWAWKGTTNDPSWTAKQIGQGPST